MRYFKSIIFYISLGFFGIAVIHVTAYYYGLLNGAKPEFLEARLLDMAVMGGLSVVGAILFIGVALNEMAFSPEGLVEYVVHQNQAPDGGSENSAGQSA